MAAVYRYLAYDLLTGALIEELPLTNVNFARVLNGAGELRGSLQMNRKNTNGVSLDAAYVAATTPQRTALYVDRDGVLVWGGLIWTRSYQHSAQRLDLQGAEFWSYFRSRRLKVNKSYTNQDQLVIARDLINYAQSVTNGNIGISVPVATSGVLRDRTQYFGYERKPIAEAVEQLAAVIDGFDFGIDVNYDVGGEPSAQLNFGYPRRGRIAQANELVFELGRNMFDFYWPEDGSNGANSITGIGAGEGVSMLLVDITDAELLDAGYPVLDDSISFKDIANVNTLADHVVSELQIRSGVRIAAKFVVLSTTDVPYGSWVMGDDARFRIYGDARFPDGLDTYLRIVGDSLDVSDAGVERITLTCSEVTGA